MKNTSNTLPETGHLRRDWILFREYEDFCKKGISMRKQGDSK